MKATEQYFPVLVFYAVKGSTNIHIKVIEYFFYSVNVAFL